MGVNPRHLEETREEELPGKLLHVAPALPSAECRPHGPLLCQSAQAWPGVWVPFPGSQGE